MSDMPNIGAVILAAGSASRFGSCKQLITIDETSLLSRTITATFSAGCKNIVVITGAFRDAVEAHVKTLGADFAERNRVQVIYNDHWDSGMGSSIKKGIEYLHNECEAAIVTVCDQPYLTDQILSGLLSKMFEDTSTVECEIVASQYSNGVLGVPVLFKRSIFPNLLSLGNATGARKVISDNINVAQFFAFPHGEIDIDTTEDLSAFLSAK